MAGKHTGAFSPIPVGSAAVPGFEWNERTTKAYAEGRGGTAPNGHPLGSDADAAWKQGSSNAGDAAFRFETAGEGPGSFPAPITFGFDFNGTSTGYAITAGVVDSDPPANFSVRFRPDAIGSAGTLFATDLSQFRVRLANSGIIQVQSGGGVLFTYTELPACQVGKDYQFDLFVNSGAADTACTLWNITDQVRTDSTEYVGGGGTTTAQIASIGATPTGLAPFTGLISAVTIAETTTTYNWPMNEDGGTTLIDTVGGVNMTLAASSGSWVPSGTSV